MHKGFLLLLRSLAHLCAISALYAVPPKKERLPAVFLCFNQWSVKNMFLFLCRFEDVVYFQEIQFPENMSFLCFFGKTDEEISPAYFHFSCISRTFNLFFCAHTRHKKSLLKTHRSQQGNTVFSVFRQTAPPHRSRRRTG